MPTRTSARHVITSAGSTSNPGWRAEPRGRPTNLAGQETPLARAPRLWSGQRAREGSGSFSCGALEPRRVAVDDPAARQVIRRERHAYHVTRYNPPVRLAHAPGEMCERRDAIRQQVHRNFFLRIVPSLRVKDNKKRRAHGQRVYPFWRCVWRRLSLARSGRLAVATVPPIHYDGEARYLFNCQAQSSAPALPCAM